MDIELQKFYPSSTYHVLLSCTWNGGCGHKLEFPNQTGSAIIYSAKPTSQLQQIFFKKIISITFFLVSM